MSSGFMKINASLILLLVSASWQTRVDALTTRRSCPSPDCLRESRTNLRGPECSCAWEEHWSEDYQKYYYINRETGQTSWYGPANRITGSWDGPANLKVFGGHGSFENRDVAPISPAIVTKACRTPEEAELLKRVEETWFDLQRNLMAQDQISSFIDCMDSPDAGSPNIKSQAEATAAEGIPVMANFLGDMWKEMRMFKNPFLKEQLLERAMQLKAKEPGLRQEYKTALVDMKRQEEAWADKASSGEDQMASKTKAVKLGEALQKEEEEESYDEEEDAKRDNQAEEDETQEAAEEAQEEKAMAADLAKAREKVAKEKTEEQIADEVAASAEEEAAKVETPSAAPGKQSNGQAKKAPQDRFVKPAWMRYLEGLDEGDAMVRSAAVEESDQVPIQDEAPQTTSVEYREVEYDDPETSSQPPVDKLENDNPQTTSQPIADKREYEIPKTTSEPKEEKVVAKERKVVAEEASWWTWPWMREKTSEESEEAPQDNVPETTSQPIVDKLKDDVPQTTVRSPLSAVVGEEASSFRWPWMRGMEKEAEVPAKSVKES